MSKFKSRLISIESVLRTIDLQISSPRGKIQGPTEIYNVFQKNATYPYFISCNNSTITSNGALILAFDW